MKRPFPILFGLIACLFGPAASGLWAGEVYSGIAGFSEKLLPAARDTYVSVPVRAGEAELGAITLEGNPDNDGNQDISIAGLGGWTTDELAARHAVRILDGDDGGLRFAISGNDAGTATVNFESAAPSPGTMAALEEEWTLDSLFPPGSQNVFHESTGKFTTGRKSELIVLSSRSNSGNVSGSRIYFIESGAWFESGGAFRAAGGDRIPVDAALIVRHPGGVGATTWTIGGVAFRGPVASRIVTDNQVSRSYSYGLVNLGGSTLSGLGLESPAFRTSSGVTPGERTDILQLFTVTLPGDPQPTTSFFTTTEGWKKTGAGTPEADSEEIPNGSVLIIKNQTPPPAHQSLWIQTGSTAP